MTIEELFGTLQQSFVESWRKHLKTPKYSAHKALNEFYDEIPELVDQLIEDYMGIHGKVKDYKNLLDSEHEDEVAYFDALRKVCKEGRELLGDSELESDMDSILSLIDSTLYKLKELKEEKSVRSLKEYLTEALVTESYNINTFWKFIDSLSLKGSEDENDIAKALKSSYSKFEDYIDDIIDSYYDLSGELQDKFDDELKNVGDEDCMYYSAAAVVLGKDFYKKVLSGDFNSIEKYIEFGKHFVVAFEDFSDSI